MFVMMGPYPQFFSGVDTTSTGLLAQKSTLLLTKTALTIFLIPPLFLNPNALAPRALWPLYLFLAVSLASTWWADDPYVSARGSFELALALIFAVSASTYLSPIGMAAVIYTALSGIVVFSAATALIMPSMGIHQPGDALQSIHAGLWRGVFAHKNLLGQLASVHFVLSLFLFRRTPWSTWLMLAMLVTSTITLTFAGSATGFAIAGGGILAWIAFTLTGRARLFTLFGGLVAILILALFRLDVAAVTAFILGRDATLTGRTAIWMRTIEQLEGRWLLGSGYVNTTELSDYLQRRFGSAVVDAHSGYLEVLSTLGLVGASALILLLGASLFAANRNASPRAPIMTVLATIPVMWIVGALSETSPFRPGNGLLLCALTATAILLRGNARDPRPRQI